MSSTLYRISIVLHRKLRRRSNQKRYRLARRCSIDCEPSVPVDSRTERRRRRHVLYKL